MVNHGQNGIIFFCGAFEAVESVITVCKTSGIDALVCPLVHADGRVRDSKDFQFTEERPAVAVNTNLHKACQCTEIADKRIDRLIGQAFHFFVR